MMNLSELQRDALLTLANSVAGHDYVPQDVLDELVLMGLVCWQTEDAVRLTAIGEKIYEKVAAEISGDALPVNLLPGS
jgi:hypothetical protein